jgi:hypothetical protein
MANIMSNFRRFVLVGAAGVALLGAGCTSSDLSQDAKIDNEVAECLPTDTPAPTVVVRAIWYPHASGFGSTDTSTVGHASGVLALAGDKLWFMSWNDDDKHYDVIDSIAFLQARSITVAHLGPSVMLVVESGNMNFDSFELLNGSRFSSDSQGTQALYGKLQALRLKNPPSDP